MASLLKTSYLAITIFLLASYAHIQETKAAGECECVAVGLTPCFGAARNGGAKVPPVCCAKVAEFLRTSPRCLCAVLLSPLAKLVGIDPAIAISIPKRCNIRNRPVGKKCGPYTLP